MKKAALLIAILSATVLIRAQFTPLYYSFDWASMSPAYSSSVVLPAICDGTPVVVTLTTDLQHQMNDNGTGTPISATHPATSILVPYPTLVTPLNFRLLFTFSSPVQNVGLLIRDLDDDSYMPGPEEHLQDFEVNGMPGFPSSIVPVSGSYSAASGIVTPLSEACRGWFHFTGTPITSISFLYTRPIANYAILLDSLKFNCRTRCESLTAGFSPVWTGSDEALQIEGSVCPDGSLEIMDLSGRSLVVQQHVESGSRISLPALDAGIYIARYSCGSEVTSRKFLVTR
jgi:hypothetical protein